MTNKQLIKKLENACVVCRDCGLKYGVYSVGCSSVWEGVCNVCGETKPVTETRDYAYLMTGIRKLLKEDVKEQSKEVADYMITQKPTMTNHPITPPPELVQQWLGNHFGTTISGEVSDVELAIATQAARWGADQELEACCGFIGCEHSVAWSSKLRDARRPKPPSLKEQALKALDHICVNHSKATDHEYTIRRALEALPND
jgi:hypothetical protein